MKKLAIRILIGLVIVLVLGFVAVGLFLDGIIKRGVETIGPKLAKVEVKLESVSLSLFSGSGKLRGFLIGNPEGFKTPSAINVGAASLALAPGSLFADKVLVRSINVQAPEITFETDFKGNNLSKILANLEAATGGQDQEAKPTQTKAGKKLQVDDFIITGGKIHISATALGGQSATVPLMDIHFTNLGQGPEGITAAELTKRVLQEIEKQATQAAAGALANVGKNAADLTKDLGKDATGNVEKITKGIGGLLNKKKN